MSKHTPGPWLIEQPNEQTPHIWIVAEGNSGIAKIECCDYDDGFGERLTEEDQANAYVISATPELFAACMAAKRLIDNINEFGACTDAELYDFAAGKVNAALSKASAPEGE